MTYQQKFGLRYREGDIMGPGKSSFSICDFNHHLQSSLCASGVVLYHYRHDGIFILFPTITSNMYKIKCLNAGDLRANSFFSLNSTPWDFLGGPVVKNLPCNAGDAGSTPGRELRSHMQWNN